MKHMLFMMLLLISSQVVCQTKKYESYTASNGVTYHIGDTVILGRGSAPDGTFRYVQMGGWAGTLNTDANNANANNIGKNYSGTGVIIKKIRSYKMKGVERVAFVVGGGNITNYELSIEDAIGTCEIRDCKQQTSQVIQVATESKYDKLKKLKELLDSGAITKDEYDQEKTKVMEEK
jgi:hypothetical protein